MRAWGSRTGGCSLSPGPTAPSSGSSGWGAVQALRDALALDPTSESVQGLYGSYLTRTLQFEEAVDAMDRALAINPLAPGPQANLVMALRKDIQPVVKVFAKSPVLHFLLKF